MQVKLVLNIVNEEGDVQNGLTERQRFIISLIVDNPYTTMLEMSTKLKVSSKTIQREIESINKTGYTVSREGGRKEGKWVVRTPSSDTN